MKTIIAEVRKERLTIGLDLGDKSSAYCVLDGSGEVVSEHKVRTTPKALSDYFSGMAISRIALETGTHSPWISRLLTAMGHEVIVANARHVRLIAQSRQKDDRLDARTLARLARVDPKLLSPVTHRSAQAQADLSLIRARAALVRSRATLINTARGLVKTNGERLHGSSSRIIKSDVSADCPSRTGHNKLLFADLGKQDACTNPSCYQAKVEAHVAATVAAKPKLVQISTVQGQQHEGSPVLPRHKYVAIQEDKPKDKAQAQWPQYKTCKFVTEAIIAEGHGQGTIQKVCANPECPVHHPKVKQQRAQTSADIAKWRAEQEKRRKEQAISEVSGIRVLSAIGAAVPVRLMKRDLLFVVERLAAMLDENRLALVAKQHGIKKAKDSDSIGKLFAAFLRRAEESVLGRLTVELTIVLAAARSNAPTVLKDAAAVYKLDADAIAAKVHKEFADKERPATRDRRINLFLRAGRRALSILHLR